LLAFTSEISVFLSSIEKHKGSNISNYNIVPFLLCYWACICQLKFCSTQVTKKHGSM